MRDVLIKQRSAVLFLLTSLALSFEVEAMAGIFGSNTLFSKVEGTVTIDGKACVGARIEQKLYKATSEEISFETSTDANGNFSFDEITEKKGLASLLPGEFVATQRLVIFYEGKEYLGWANTKRSPEPNSESEGKRFSLVCDLSKEQEEDDQYKTSNTGYVSAFACIAGHVAAR